MKKVLLFTLILTLAAGVAFAKDYEVSKKAGAYTVLIKIDKNPPVVGKNQMVIGIKDAKGGEVADAAVTAEYGMPPMPGMGAMHYKAKVESSDGLYGAVLNFSMSGPWYVNIKITKAGKTQTAKLNIDVQ